MRKDSYKRGLLLFILTLFVSCQYKSVSYDSGHISEIETDSQRMLWNPHYTLNSNFEVISDSLLLRQLPLMEVLTVYKGEEVVVAEFMIQPADSVDSVWVKVAHNQEVMGWVHETELLRSVVPVNIVSQFIYVISNSNVMIFIGILVTFGLLCLYHAVKKEKLQWVWHNDIDSVYPAIFSFLVAFSAILYVSMQHFVPDAWKIYYYNLSLNPFEWPFIMALFIVNIWALLLVGMAALDDLFRQVSFKTAFFYLLGLFAVSIFLCLFFMYAVQYYIGYACLLAYGVWACLHIAHILRYKYLCGACGRKLKEKGICPHCGALNE